MQECATLASALPRVDTLEVGTLGKCGVCTIGVRARRVRPLSLRTLAFAIASESTTVCCGGLKPAAVRWVDIALHLAAAALTLSQQLPMPTKMPSKVSSNKEVGAALRKTSLQRRTSRQDGMDHVLKRLRRGSLNLDDLTNMLLYLNAKTFVGEEGAILATEVSLAKAAGIEILLVHENDAALDGCPFFRVLQKTPHELIADGLYNKIAVACHPGPHCAVSLAMLAKSLGAIQRKSGLGRLRSSPSETTSTRRSSFQDASFETQRNLQKERPSNVLSMSARCSIGSLRSKCSRASRGARDTARISGSKSGTRIQDQLGV